MKKINEIHVIQFTSQNSKKKKKSQLQHIQFNEK